MKDKNFYYQKMVKSRRVIFCVRLTVDPINNLNTYVGMAVANPIDKFELEKGKMIATARAATVIRGNSPDKIRFKRPYVYREFIEKPFWRGIDFEEHVSRIFNHVYTQVKTSPEKYIPAIL